MTLGTGPEGVTPLSLVEVLAVSTGAGSAGEDWTTDTDSLRMWLPDAAVPLPLLLMLLPETPTGDEECAVESKTTDNDAFPGDETVPVLVVVTKFLVIVCTSSLTAFRVAMGICGRDGAVVIELIKEMINN